MLYEITAAQATFLLLAVYLLLEKVTKNVQKKSTKVLICSVLLTIIILSVVDSFPNYLGLEKSFNFDQTAKLTASLGCKHYCIIFCIVV